MEYRLRIEEDIVPLEVETGEEKNMKVSVGENVFNVSYSLISENQIHLVINGDGVNAYLADSPDGKIVVIGGIPHIVQDADVLDQDVTRKKGPKDIPREVTPPMPSVVVRIMVNEGDTVEKGESVIVVTAMKMESTLCAPFNGRVTKINAAIGDKVMPGEILVNIEEDEETGTNKVDDPADH